MLTPFFICFCLFLGLLTSSNAIYSIQEIYGVKDATLLSFNISCQDCGVGDINRGRDPTVHLANDQIYSTGALGFEPFWAPWWDGLTSSIIKVELMLPPLTEYSIAPVYPSCVITIVNMGSGWDEYTITANNAPVGGHDHYFFVLDEVIDRGSLPWEQYRVLYKRVDITSYVKELLNNGSNEINFMLFGSADCAFPAKESYTDPAFLRIHYYSDGPADRVPCSYYYGCTACCDDMTSGPTCYGEASHDCVVGVGGNRICANGHAVCGTTCYDPTQYRCYNNHNLCPAHLGECAGACYNFDRYTCVNGNLQQI